MIIKNDIYEKRYIQFNNLVFDAYDMISDYDAETTFKGSSIEYTGNHGSYRPFKKPYLYISERSVSMTITVNLLKLPCEYREYYLQFAEEELTKPGKLWAVKNNELIWANAVVQNLSQVISSRKNVVVYDVEFIIPGGIWNKANKQKTFLVPFDICTFMDCMGYQRLQPCREYDCVDGDCCQECQDNHSLAEQMEACDCCCEGELTPDMMLCYHLNELQAFYTCEVPYQIVYNCQKGAQFNQAINHEDFMGKKLCVTDCNTGVIAGRFYSETDIPTEDIEIVIQGAMVNPWITINGNTNIIKGEYSGALIIKANGDVYYQTNSCCEGELLDPSVWIVPEGMNYGWTVNPRVNSIVINTNQCCENGRTCVFIQDNAITL